MSGKIKCTYEDCFKHFKTELAMKKHKEKDPDHFYCKRCNVDCEDDTEFLIHQIISPKHLACPTCGAEFDGNAARDLHVEVRHKKKQALKCVGCDMVLTGASAYVGHIAKGECDVITLEAFDRLRAERQIQKDAWEAALDTQSVTYSGSSILPSNADSNGGAPLLDEDYGGTSNGHRTTSQLDSRITPLKPATSTTPHSTNKLSISVAALSIDTYPPLSADFKPSQPLEKGKNVSQHSVDKSDDLLYLDDTKVNSGSGAQEKSPIWSPTDPASRRFFPAKEEKAYPSQSDLSGISNNRTTLTKATYGGDTNIQGSSATRDQSNVPKAARPVNNDPNAPFRGVQTAPRIVPHSIIDPMDYYDEIRNRFTCTGKDCGRSFDSAEGFKAHLVTGAHVGGQTQCPSCLKKFATTWALIAHCESPSRRCKINKSANYNQILRELTAGLLGTEGHTEDGTGDVRYVANPVNDWVNGKDEDDEFW